MLSEVQWGFFYGSFFAFCLPLCILMQFWPSEVFLVDKKPVEYLLVPKEVWWVCFLQRFFPLFFPFLF
jgi:hypothetical protein